MSTERSSNGEISLRRNIASYFPQADKTPARNISESIRSLNTRSYTPPVLVGWTESISLPIPDDNLLDASQNVIQDS